MSAHRNLLATALLAALPVAGHAELTINAQGRGDALYLPLYQVTEDRDSLLTIRNTGDTPSLARVVFVESLNGQMTLSFNVLLPAKATWTAAVVDDGAAARLFSRSDLCTVPAIPQAGVQFRNFDYRGNFPDSGPTNISRTRTGAVEVFELATVQGELAGLLAQGKCGDIIARYSNNIPRAASLAAPSSQLTANVQVVEVANGTVYALPAITISGFTTTPIDALPAQSLPRLISPQLADGATHHVANTPSGRFRFASNRGADAVSSLFMASSISGEVISDQALQARTQWLYAFPTKNAYVFNMAGSLAGDNEVLPPFRKRFDAAGSCEPLTVDAYGVDGADRVAAGYDVCDQVTLRDFDATAPDGSDSVQLADDARRHIDAEREDGTPVRLRGLPVVGWRLSSFVNAGAQPGVLANYTVALPLQTEPAIVVAR